MKPMLIRSPVVLLSLVVALSTGAAAFGALDPPALAATPLYSADFEQGLVGWTVKPAITVEKTFRIEVNEDDGYQSLLSGGVWTGYWFVGVGSTNGYPTVAGLRFRNLAIPKGAQIDSARLELVAARSNIYDASFDIWAESSDDSSIFESYQEIPFSDLPRSQAQVQWIPGHWNEGARYQTVDLKTVVQETVDRPGWQRGNAMSLFIAGQGERQIYQRDHYYGSGEDHVQLHVTFQSQDGDDLDITPVIPTTFERKVRSAHGDVGVNSSNYDGDPRMSGARLGEHLYKLHFDDIYVPQGAQVTHAEIEIVGFSNNPWNIELAIQGEDSDDARSFRDVLNDYSNRPKTTALVNSTVPTWEDWGTSYISDDLSSIVQEIVDRGGWSSGNDMAFFLIGDASTYIQVGEYENGMPATLRITYDGPPEEPDPTNLPAGQCASSWSGSSAITVETNVYSPNPFYPPEFGLIVDNALPNAPIKVEGQVVGCSDDDGYFYGRALPVAYLPDCNARIEDPSSYVDQVLTNCVAWERTYYPDRIDADDVHYQANHGTSVVAIVDSGIMENQRLAASVWARYDAITDSEGTALDENGHGTHVASVIGSRGWTEGPRYNSIAPRSRLAIVKAFDAQGQGTYADVIRGIDWVVTNKDELDISVLNLSLSAPPQSHYWDDPLNQAVMRAWDAGIVVVASAGNTGPDPMTIGVPGNLPYIITVGAMSDNYTPAVADDDILASFSSTGPTFEGFVKPDVVAPGGHLLGLMDFNSTLATEHPEFHNGGDEVPYFTMSGTSQAAAVVSGAVALMLTAEPDLSPDDVKCRLMTTARPAVDGGGLAYSIFQQGAGLINVYDAIQSDQVGCANIGLDITKDLADTEHYKGAANMGTDEQGDPYYYIEGLDGFAWGNGYVFSDGFAWSSGFVWNNGFLWADGFAWSNGFAWSSSVTWDDTTQVDTASTSGINVWVAQE